jgi:hypothetical protein
MNTMISYILGRLKEPSTYTGLATLLSMFGLSVPNTTVQAISTVGIAVSGALWTVLPSSLGGAAK